MKKVRIAFLLVVLLFAGCSKETDIENPPAAVIEEEQILEEADAISDRLAEYKGYFYFDRLIREEQIIYTEILQILSQWGKDGKVSCMDTAVLEKVFQCVLNDHPEIFYVDGYTFTKYTLDEELKKITFTGTYSIDKEEADKRQKEIQAFTEHFKSLVPAESDEYEKVKFVYEYLIEQTEYNAQAIDNQNICSVFLNGQSVCQGYAKAMQYLLEELNVFATLVIGRVSEDEGHAWNLVQIDGNYYYVDPTWGDASYQMEEAEKKEDHEQEHLPTINYDYLCVTTKQLCKTHTIENVVELPECTSMEANYYVREGAYFSTVDMDKLEALFSREYEKGSTYITLKCADLEIYKEMQKVLIEEQEIFRYLDSPDGVIAYADNAEQLCLSFWL